MYEMFTFVNTISIFACIIALVSGIAVQSDVLHRSRRQYFPLLFLNSTLLQFNAGIGTPSVAKNINFNFAFQANFQLPWNRTQVPDNILSANNGYDQDARKKRSTRDGDYENNARLFHFYKFVEEILNGVGHDGKACVRQALCQIGSEPLHSDDKEDLLHELASFLLNPINDIDGQISDRDEAYPYVKAYKQGQNLEHCTKLYPKCKMSLVDIFSELHVP